MRVGACCVGIPGEGPRPPHRQLPLHHSAPQSAAADVPGRAPGLNKGKHCLRHSVSRQRDWARDPSNMCACQSEDETVSAINKLP